jgi:hypothetical protein
MPGWVRLEQMTICCLVPVCNSMLVLTRLFTVGTAALAVVPRKTAALPAWTAARRAPKKQCCIVTDSCFPSVA